MTRLRQLDMRLFRSRHGTRWRVWDFTAGVFSFCLAFLLTPHKSAMPATHYIFVVGIIYGFMLAISGRVCGIPVPGQRSSRYELIASAVLAVGLTYIVFSVLVGLVLVRAYGRYIVAITTGFSLLAIVLPRWWLMALLKSQPLKIVIYGAGEKGRALAERLRRDSHFKVVGFLDNNPAYHGSQRFGLPVFGSIHNFGREQLKKLGTDIVVVSVVARRLIEENARTIMELPLDHIEVLNLGGFAEYYFKEISIDYGCPEYFASSPSVPGNPSIFAAKRLMDVGGALAGLALTLPLWPFIALAVKLDTPGPVFFRQARVGRGGRLFDIVKFRTMVDNAEENGAQWAAKSDPRTTRTGRILRATRLDELPQFLNVLRGEMSLVGPRPERPEFVEELTNEIPFYEQRHLVPPGLTGWAQVRYRYGASKEDAKRKLQYELYYVRHLSVMFDIEILLRTIPMVAKGSR